MSHTLVQFYTEGKASGWHYGYLLESDKKVAIVKPLIPGKHSRRVPIENVKPVEKEAVCPAK